jgi:aryl-alcohol dehydrogenase-like predicted oxidoreductase
VEHRELGRSGVRVPRIALGCGNFGGVGSAPEFFGQGVPRAEAFRLLDRAYELGLTLFDTADAYGGGSSEEWIGDWLATKGPAVRERVVLLTKVFNPMAAGADHGLAPARVRRQLDSSLARLRVERVDLYLLHEPDPETPLAETLGAFDELVSAGKIGAYGVSNVDGAYLREALAAGSPCCVQNSYSLLDRRDEAEVLPLCAAHGLGYTPFGPLAGGWLTGKYRRGQPFPAGSRMTQRPEPYGQFVAERVFAGVEQLEAAAAGHGVSAAALAFAWLLAHPHVTAVVSGPGRAEHLEPLREALAVSLDPGERERIGSFFE